ncbi:hypothetical protein CEXT_232581 [Caerostris extrusa]|uniref:Uncharacterized protein n=1 Tax=Caerostris extrusa TaxID=172846 RepID=A0AAV4X7X2_CAEEX|nr:hypothetical protein CEXT_232581 [Caerostris extrusa]
MEEKIFSISEEVMAKLLRISWEKNHGLMHILPTIFRNICIPALASQCPSYSKDQQKAATGKVHSYYSFPGSTQHKHEPWENIYSK